MSRVRRRLVRARVLGLLFLLTGCDAVISLPPGSNGAGSNGGGGDSMGGTGSAGGGTVDPCMPAAPVTCVDGSTPARIWSLSRTELDNSVAALLHDTSAPATTPFPPENRTNGFSSNPRAWCSAPTSPRC